MSKPSTSTQIKSGRGKLTAARIGCYIFLIFLCFLCLFFFYMLLINSSRNSTGLFLYTGFLFPDKSAKYAE